MINIGVTNMTIFTSSSFNLAFELGERYDLILLTQPCKLVSVEQIVGAMLEIKQVETGTL